jgi:hypothetical protein
MYALMALHSFGSKKPIYPERTLPAGVVAGAAVVAGARVVAGVAVVPGRYNTLSAKDTKVVQSMAVAVRHIT